MSEHPHQPERFEVYNMRSDGKSFTIHGCDAVFYLDQHGGWKDEFGNYYNSNGDPDEEPSDADYENSQNHDYEYEEGSDYSD